MSCGVIHPCHYILSGEEVKIQLLIKARVILKID